MSVIGGGSRSLFWGRILASVLDRPLTFHAGGELGPAFGAARLARLAAGDETHRGWEWKFLEQRSDTSLRRFDGADSFLWAVAYGPDGERLAAAGGNEGDTGGYDDSMSGDDPKTTFEEQGAFSPPLSFSNVFPEIVSDGGGATATIAVSTGATAVTTVIASDANSGDWLSFDKSGTNHLLFELSATSTIATGTTTDLTFIDAAEAGSYEVTITVTDHPETPSSFTDSARRSKML